MTSSTITSVAGDAPVRRPSIIRRAALAATTFFAGAIPFVWGVASLGELLSGTESDHRFHQLTGQGVLLAVLWLGSLAPLVRAGWRGAKPSRAAGLQHLAFVVATVLAACLAPGNGGGVVAAIVVVTGGLLWLAMPARPTLRGTFDGLDPVIAPVALLTTALLTPYALGQAADQRAMADEHAELSHYFDMAWIAVIIVLFALVAAVSSSCRRLVMWAGVSQLVLAGAALAFTSNTGFGLLVATTGAAGVAAALARRRSGRDVAAVEA